MFNKNSGYTGFSMSNRAAEAYTNGEKPYSKWTKREILEKVREISADKEQLLSRLPLNTLKDTVLVRTSWHHTSSRCNRTDFYSVSDEAVQNFSEDQVTELCQKTTSEKAASLRYPGEIRYLEWSGTRAHPHAETIVLKDVMIEERGSFYYIYKNGEEILKKKIGSNGTEIINYDVEERKRQRAEERRLRIQNESSKEALEFYEKIKEHCERSSSFHIYPQGRKPGRVDYENGLENFFSLGEKRLSENVKTGVLTLETWNGTEWIVEK
jgi:hypothetical protein